VLCQAGPRANKVILLIGDGMGPSHLSLLKTAWQYGRNHKLVANRENSYDRILAKGEISLISTMPAGYVVADSACASSSISTGINCLPETLGIDAEGRKVEIFSEFARRNNIAVGLVSDTRLTHATPAGFYGHSRIRNDEKLLATQFLTSGIQLAFSGGLKYFSKSEAHDASIETLKGKGYGVVRSKEELKTISSLPVVGLFSDSGMPDAIEMKYLSQIPSLLEMTEKALNLFSDKESYFLMVEAGQIDWASHENDAGLLLEEMLRFEVVLDYLMSYVEQNPDTTLIVTSDHETGGFGFSYHQFPEHEVNGKTFAGYKPRYDFINEDILQNLFSQKASFRTLAKEIQDFGFKPSLIKQTLGKNIKSKISSKLIEELNSIPKLKTQHLLKSVFGEGDHNYVDDDNLIQVIIGKYVYREEGVVWSTGTHTMPLIPLVIYGREQEDLKQRPKDLVEVGKMLRKFYLEEN
jgi:alkaline phosphatase